MTFHVGQKVVCIKGDDWLYPDGSVADVTAPKTNTVYTVRAIRHWPHLGPKDQTGILIAEIINPPALHQEGFHEPYYNTAYFRPVAERKTDISIFTAMLTPKKVKEPISYLCGREG